MNIVSYQKILSENRLFDEGVKYLSEAIVSDNCQLRELCIADVGLTSDGAMRLAEALESRKCKLRGIICLRMNNINRTCRMKLIDVCKNKDILMDEIYGNIVNAIRITMS